MTAKILKQLPMAALLLLIATNMEFVEAKSNQVVAKKAERPVGIVFEIKDSAWKAVTPDKKRETRLVVGSGIPSKSELKRTTPGKGWILIGFLDGTETKFGLDGKDEIPINVDRNENPFTRFASAWVDALTKNPDQFVSALSRDASTPKDGVVELTSEGVLLAGVLPKALLGDQLFSMTPLSETNSKSEITSVSIQKEVVPVLKVTGLKPGVYRLQRHDTSAMRKPVGGDAWLLVTSSEDFKTKKEEFQKGSEDIGRWAQNAQDRVRRNLVRAHLQSLVDVAIEKVGTGATN